MASLLPGYEYDIFISYRHKDNKYDGWVSEFVSNLRKEVEATVKYDVSIYFDENSYDGLLENHEVDESLRKKLRCLIFIPIISQTYCDEKSFAWQHEFLSFLTLSSTDHYRVKIELPNHNVASRILPVRIHEIDQEDKDLIESHLGGPIRPIDFIYRSAGVNRPLRPKDDELKAGNTQAVYRNQVNKVANAIKEILTGFKIASGVQIPKLPDQVPSLVSTRRTKRILALTGLVILVLSLAGYASYFYFNSRQSSSLAELDKSIAILPFRDLSADRSQQYFGDGVSEMIRTNLSQVNDLSVTSMQSVLQYRDSKKTIPQIGEELKVGHVLEGSILKDGNSIRVIVQLIEAGSDKHIWSETYDRSLEQIFVIQSDIAQHVVTMLKLKLSDREKEVVESRQETSLAAYDHTLAGQYSINKLVSTGDEVYTDRAISQFKNALALDSSSIEALSGLGRAFYAKAYYGKGEHWLDSAFSVAQRILKVNSNRSEGYALLGRVYYDKSEQQMAKANLEEALERDPNNIRTLRLLSYIYMEERNFEKGIPLNIKAARLSPSGISDGASSQYINIGYVLFEGGYFELAEEAWRKHTMLYPDDFFDGYESLVFLKLLQGKTDEAKNIVSEHLNKPTDLEKIDNPNYINNYAWIYYLTRQYDTAQRYLLAVEKLDSLGFEEGIHTNSYKHRLAHIYKMKGERNKSEKLFNEHLASLEKTVKEGKSRFGLEYDLAGAYAFLGDKDKAFFWLKKMPYNTLVTIFIQIDPLFDSIRNDPQFRAVIEKQQRDREEIRRVIELEKVQQELKLVLR